MIVTITSSFDSILKASQIRPGVHRACMGTDTKGKQEVEAELVARARLFTDEVAQSVTIGECQHAVAAGLVGRYAIVEIVAAASGEPMRSSDRAMGRLPERSFG